MTNLKKKKNVYNPLFMPPGTYYNTYDFVAQKRYVPA